MYNRQREYYIAVTAACVMVTVAMILAYLTFGSRPSPAARTVQPQLPPVAPRTSYVPPPALPSPVATQASAQPPAALAPNLHALTLGAPIDLGIQMQRCYVSTVCVTHIGTSYSADGNPRYSFRVDLAVTNNTSTPKGPRVTVTLWNADGFQSTSFAVADSLDGDLSIGQAKTFSDTMYCDFQPISVSVSEKI